MAGIVALPVIPIPVQPQDPAVTLPAVPVAPPNSLNVYQSVQYQRNVLNSLEQRPLGSKASRDDFKAAVIYAHRIAAQAAAPQAAAADVVAPAWFGPAIDHALERFDIRLNGIESRLGRMESDMKLLLNYNRAEGNVLQYDIVPFLNGDDPTGPLHGLRPLVSLQAVSNLPPQQVVLYLNGYGYGGQGQPPLPAGQNLVETDSLRKDLLKRKIAGRS